MDLKLKWWKKHKQLVSLWLQIMLSPFDVSSSRGITYPYKEIYNGFTLTRHALGW